MDLKVRPIHHHLERRVRSHILLCMLAYYVQWHMLEAWRELLFSDQDQQVKQTRDPVAPAKRSTKALLQGPQPHAGGWDRSPQLSHVAWGAVAPS
jgi:hypothetical protein